MLGSFKNIHIAFPGFHHHISNCQFIFIGPSLIMKSFLAGIAKQRKSGQPVPVPKLDSSSLDPFVQLLETTVKQKNKSPDEIFALVDDSNTSNVVNNFNSGLTTVANLETQSANILWSAMIQIVRQSEPILSDVNCTTLSTGTAQDVNYIASILPPHHRQLLGALLSASEIIIRVDKRSAEVVTSSLSGALMKNLSPKPDDERSNAFCNLIGNQRIDFPFGITFARKVGINVEPIRTSEWITILAIGPPHSNKNRQPPVSDRVELLDDEPSFVEDRSQPVGAFDRSRINESLMSSTSTTASSSIKRKPSMNPDEFEIPYESSSRRGSALENSGVGRANDTSSLVKSRPHSSATREESKLESDEDESDHELLVPGGRGPGASGRSNRDTQAGVPTNNTELALAELQQVFSSSLVPMSALESRLRRNVRYDEDYADIQ